MGGLITLSPYVAHSLPKGPSEILFPGDGGKKREMEVLSLPNLPTLWFKAALKIATGLCSQAWRPAGKKQTAIILLLGRHSLPSPRVPALGLGSRCFFLLRCPSQQPRLSHIPPSFKAQLKCPTFPDLPPLSPPNGL